MQRATQRIALTVSIALTLAFAHNARADTLVLADFGVEAQVRLFDPSDPLAPPPRSFPLSR